MNGELKGTYNDEFRLGVSPFAFAIGMSYNQYSHAPVGGSFSTTESIRDVRVYDVALNDQNVSDLYDAFVLRRRRRAAVFGRRGG